MLRDRRFLEELEKKTLESYAVKSAESIGRKFSEKEDDFRLAFQKDKERIIHSKAFRRLDQKTQVFIARTGDHYRTRLTHTIEVAQIARGIARILGLNEDLSEVIALAHDLGHPPYGHSGEDALDDILREHNDHFEHNEQSRRIVEKLEKSYVEFDGLNLTFEVIDGMIKHQTAFDQAYKKFEFSAHLEAQVVNLADEIAYINHDIDDGLRSGLVSVEELRKLEVFNDAEEKAKNKHGNNMSDEVLKARTVSTMISNMIEDLCRNSVINIDKFQIQSVNDVRNLKNQIVCFSDEMRTEVNSMREFLYDNFYLNEKVVSFTNEGKKQIKSLFHYLMENPDKIPEKEYLANESEIYIRVKDYIAGMTDPYLADAYRKFCL